MNINGILMFWIVKYSTFSDRQHPSDVTSVKISRDIQENMLKIVSSHLKS